MSIASWKAELYQTLQLAATGERAEHLPQKKFPQTCLIGVGSDLRGDDSAGLLIARSLLQRFPASGPSSPLIIEGGPAPENHTGKLRSFKPGLVILIDAAHLGEPPGTIEWIPLDSIDGMSASSHSLPLSMLACYLTLEFDCRVAVLGIQPGQNDIGADLSPAVRRALDEIIEAMSGGFSGSPATLSACQSPMSSGS